LLGKVFVFLRLEKIKTMLTLKTITENTESVISRLAKKNFDATAVIAEVIELNSQRKAAQTLLDNTLAEMNALSKEIGELFKAGKQNEANQAKARTVELKDAIKLLGEQQDAFERKLTELLLAIPNLPHESVPEGRRAEDNVVERTGGVVPELQADAVPHWDLAKRYDLIDFELGVKITGAGFPVYKGKGARLQRALINFFLDNAREAGYLEVQPPYLVNAASGYGTGNLPDKEGQMYHATLDDLYLIPTAEVPVTNMYRDVILTEKELPVKNTAYSACFRREAGSYGKDVRGLNRLHQFDKVEIVQIQHPDKSYDTLTEMVNYVQSLIEKLELPYRVLRLCGGDMSFTSALTFDFEVYSAAQQRWLEVSSVSNFESYQANRLKCRFKGEDKKTQLCHTLNGSALALPRIVAALLENHQTPDGIRIPKALVPYCGFEMID
jgi:seryl-tRNA synthetase